MKSDSHRKVSIFQLGWLDLYFVLYNFTDPIKSLQPFKKQKILFWKILIVLISKDALNWHL